MSLKTEWVPYGPGGEYSGYLAYEGSAAQKLPGLLVVQEAGGVNAHMEDVTRRFAAAGYAAFAPDLFARHARRPAALYPERIDDMLVFMHGLTSRQRMDPKERDLAIAALPKEQGALIRESVTTLFAGGFLPPLVAAAAHLRNEVAVTRGQKLGALGFCMGGGLSAMLATVDPELAGAVMFYGRMPPADDLARIRCPVLAFYGSADRPLVDSAGPFQEAMKKHGKSLEVVVYEGAEHAFFNDTRPLYDVNAARDSFVRALGFLRRQLA